MRSRWKKIALIGALALVGVELVYVVAANAILRTQRIESWISDSTDNVRLELEGVYTLWPGRVHLDRVYLRLQDHNVQFSLALEHAVVDVSLLELPWKTLHLTRVRGDNVQFLFRHKVEDPKGLERRLAHYPKIPGFADPPVYTGTSTSPLSDEEYDLWTVELDDVEVGVRELWFLEYRFVGQGRARGAFRLQPQRSAETAPCELTLDGTLSAGPHTVANALRGRIDFELHRFDPREVSGPRNFSVFSMQTDLRGEVPNLEASELYRSEDFDLSRGSGPLRIELDYARGAWNEGSRVHYRTDGLTIRKDATVVSGAVELEAKITKPGKDARVALTADVPRAALDFHGVPRAIQRPSFERVRAVFGATADLAKPHRWTSLSAELRAVVPALRWLNQPLDEPELFRGGSAEARARIEWSEGERAAVDLALDAERASFLVSDQPMQISGKLVSASRYDPETRRGLSGKLQLELPEVSLNADPVPGGLTLRSERLQWRGLPPEQLDGRFVLTGDTVEPLVPLVIPSDILRALAKLLVSLGKTRAVFEVARTPAAWELSLGEAKSGEVELFGQLRAEHAAEHPCGRFYVQDAPLGVGVVVAGGETSVEPLVSAGWWRERPVTARCEPRPARRKK